MSGWCVYILKCADRSYYTGITNDMEKRLAAHEAGKGAKYTKGRSPLRLVYQEFFAGRSEASQREYQIKRLTRPEKEAVIQVYLSELAVRS